MPEPQIEMSAKNADHSLQAQYLQSKASKIKLGFDIHAVK